MLRSLLGSLFLALRTKLALMRSYARSQDLHARTMTMDDAYQIKIMLQSCAPNGDSNSLTYNSSDFTVPCAALCATHIQKTCRINVYYVNGRVMHGQPCDSWGTNT